METLRCFDVLWHEELKELNATQSQEKWNSFNHGQCIKWLGPPLPDQQNFWLKDFAFLDSANPAMNEVPFSGSDYGF